MPNLPPLEMYVSRNVVSMTPASHWQANRHYQANFNALNAVLPTMVANAPWAIQTDWRRWLILTPEEERLCIRTMGELIEQGLQHVAVVVEDHPVIRWQVQHLKEQHEDLHFATFVNKEDSWAWLARHGYDTDFHAVPFDPRWMHASKHFDAVLDKLEVDKSHFVSLVV